MGVSGRHPGLRLRGLWPDRLAGRVSLVLLIAMLVEFTGSSLLYQQVEILNVDRARLERAAYLIGSDRRLLEATSPERRATTAGLLSSPVLGLAWRPPAPPVPRGAAMPDGPDPLPGVQARLAARLGIPPDRMRLSGRRPDGTVQGEMRLSDGSILAFSIQRLLGPPRFARGLLLASLLAACVLLAAVALMRTLSRPLDMLARAADGIGRGPPAPIAARGPREVRDLARTLEAMQARIGQMIADRTEALAAVSHDLRTPLARLRLRAGFLEPDMQAPIEADLDEMEAMVGSVLSYLAGEQDAEPRRIVDLAVLLQTLVDEATDMGGEAAYLGPSHLSARLRPLATRRVFTNLISNALAYAGRVRIRLSPDERGVEIAVEDDGPGIPPDELERVLNPFYRLEVSRSRATGGLGLGLAIVRREVGRDGGTLHLANREAGGLRVLVRLPDSDSDVTISQ